jgi:PAS domain S-box-containing protein
MDQPHTRSGGIVGNDRTDENNRVLNELLGAAVAPLPLDQILGNCLDILLRLSWLSLLPKAGIFLTETSADGRPELKLVAERNLGEPIRTLCAKVAFGHCLCGRAAHSRVSVHASCLDERHETLFDGIEPHGHYNIPIVSNGEVLGVIVFYLPHGTERYDDGVMFLERVADTLAMVVSFNRQSAVLSQKLRELDYQQKALDEHAIVSVTDVKGIITYANDRFCEISGYSREELIGAPHSIVKSDEHSPEFYRMLWRTIASGHVWRGEIKNRRKNGGYYWIAATIVPFIGEDGKPFQYVAIRTDITREKNRELALQKASAEAEAANVAKSQFLATMSHEIRTPMTGVLGFAELLVHDKTLAEGHRRYVHSIMDASRSLLAIINDILDMSKLEAGKVELEYLDLDLPALIEDVLHLFREKRQRRQSKNLTVIAELSDDFPKGINSDPTRLRQILVNLVGNGVKFTEEGSVSVIGSLLDADTAQPMIRIGVRDTGIGIPPDAINRLFTEFNQGDPTISRRFEGTGLGLSICRKLVEILGGEIGVESEVGKGSEFWFTLPYRACIERSDAVRSPAAPIGYYVGVKPLNVLIVDDNALNRQIMGAIVDAFGHSHVSATNGAEALEFHGNGMFDVILMDIRMPGMSGPDTTRAIRAMEGQKSQVPIIAVTADAMTDNVSDHLKAGMDAIVTKPIDRAELARAINRVVGEDVHVIAETIRNDPDAPKDIDAEAAHLAAAADFLKEIGVSEG